MILQAAPQTDLLGHPLTILLLSGLATLLAYLIKVSIDHGKMLSTLTTTAADIKELLMLTRKDQEETRSDLDELRYEHAALAGEHKKKQPA